MASDETQIHIFWLMSFAVADTDLELRGRGWGVAGWGCFSYKANRPYRGFRRHLDG